MNDRFTYESGVIGSCILYGEIFPDISADVRPEYFTNITYKHIYESSLSALAHGRPIDPITISEEMKDRGFWDNDSAKLITDLMGLAPAKSEAMFYVKKLVDIAKLKMMKDSIGIAIKDCKDLESLSEAIMSSVSSIERGNARDTQKTLSECVDEFISWAKGEHGEPIKTGHLDIDAMLHGIMPGKLGCIAARPGIGKSALSTEIAIKVASNCHKVALFSMEMPRLEIMQRLVSMKSRVRLDKIIDRSFTSGENAKPVANALQDMRKIDMIIDENPNIKTIDIRRLLQRHKDIDAVFIDYLQLMTTVDRTGNRNNEIGDITRELKVMAMEFQVPIIILSQLNRNKDELQEPGLPDLRDSGNIEQDIDWALFLWKLEHAQKGEMQKIGAKIAKNRQGETGVCVMYFDCAHMTFHDSDEEYIPVSNGFSRDFYPISGHDKDFPFK